MEWRPTILSGDCMRAPRVCDQTPNSLVQGERSPKRTGRAAEIEARMLRGHLVSRINIDAEHADAPHACRVPGLDLLDCVSGVDAQCPLLPLHYTLPLRCR